MTLEDFRRLVSRITLTAPLRPAVVAVKTKPSAQKRRIAPRAPVRPSPLRPV